MGREERNINLVVHGIHLEVVGRMPTAYRHCHRCNPIFKQSRLEEGVNREAVREYPEAVQEEFVWLSDILGELDRLYGSRIVITLTDAVSIPGMYKTIRYRLRTYPAFIVNKHVVVSGRDRERLLRVIEEHLHNTGQ